MKKELRPAGICGSGIDPDILRCLGRRFAFPKEGRISVLNPEFGDGADVCRFLEGMAGESEWERAEVFGLDQNRVHVQDHGEKLDYAITGDLLSKGIRISNGCFGLCFCVPPARDIGKHSRAEAIYLGLIGRRLKANGGLCYIVKEEVFRRSDFRKAMAKYFCLKRAYRLPGKDWNRKVALIACRQQSSLIQEEVAKEMEKMLLDGLPSEEDGVPCIEVPASSPDGISEFSGAFDERAASMALAGAGFPKTLRGILFPEKQDKGELQRSPQPPDEGKLIMLGITNQVPGRIGEEGRNMILKRGSGGRLTTSVFDERNGVPVIVDTTRNEAAVNILLPDGEARTLQ